MSRQWDGHVVRTERQAGRTPDGWLLEFGGYPPSPNDRLHWRQRHAIGKRWRDTVRMAAWMLGIPHCDRIRVSAVLLRPTIGRSDEDNDRARLKPVLDGIVAAGVITDDTRQYVEWGTVTEERGPRGLRLLIDRIEEEED